MFLHGPFGWTFAGKEELFAGEEARAFTLIELLVVLAIISLLVSILIPSLQKAKDLARTVVCMSQLRNFGLATQYYMEDFNNYYPLCMHPTISGNYWHAMLGRYLGVNVPYWPPSWEGERIYIKDHENTPFACPSNNAGGSWYSGHRTDYKVIFRSLGSVWGLAGYRDFAACLRPEDVRIPLSEVIWIVDGQVPPDGNTKDAIIWFNSSDPQNTIEDHLGTRHRDQECNILWGDNNTVTTAFPDWQKFRNR